MKFGDKIEYLREQIDISQQELGRRIGTSGSIIGRYEREEMTPSIDVVKKLAEALDVSIDYLVDEEDKLSAFKDKKIIERIAEIEKLPEEDKNHIYYAIDGLVRDAKTRMAYSK